MGSLTVGWKPEELGDPAYTQEELDAQKPPRKIPTMEDAQLRYLNNKLVWARQEIESRLPLINAVIGLLKQRYEAGCKKEYIKQLTQGIKEQ